MDEAHKEKLRLARNAARARKLAADAEVVEVLTEKEQERHLLQSKLAQMQPKERVPTIEEIPSLNEIERAELEALRKQVADKREKAAHEHPTISGRERVNMPEHIGGAQADVQESLRELIREQLAETFPERQPIRKTTRESIRPNAVIAYDREGNPVYRKRDQTADPFGIPDDLKDPQWELQWCRVSVYGQEDVSHQVALSENGWRFVQADSDRWRGRMMPSNYKGAIFRDGLALMERPKILSDEARAEAGQKVKEQSRAQREQFGMALPSGFTNQTPAAQQFSFARAGKPEATPANLKPDLSTRTAMDIDQ